MSTGSGYTVPFGLDPRQFFEGLNNIEQGFDDITDDALKANQAMQQAFNQSAQSAEKFGQTIDVESKRLQQLRDQARTLGREVGEALSGKGVTAGFENRIKAFGSQLDKLRNQARVNVQVDDARLKAFEQELVSTNGELQQLAVVIRFAQEQLSKLDPGSEEWKLLNQQIVISEELLNGINEAVEESTGKQKTLKSELRALKEEMAALELAGEGNSQEFREMAARAGELEDQIGDVSARVRVLASDTKYIDAGVEAFTGLVGVFTAAQGAAALFGDENEDLNRALQKVTGAMAVLQGVQAVANALNKDSALSVLLLSRGQAQAATTTTALAGATTAEAAATTTATVATRSWTAALLANPIVLIAAAVVAATAALVAFIASSDDATESTEEFNAALDRNAKFLQVDEAAINRRTQLLSAMAKASGKAESDVTAIEGRALAERLNLRRENLAELQRMHDDENSLRSRSAEDQKRIGDEILAAQEEIADLEVEIEVKRLERRKQLSDEEKEATKKRAEQAKKDLEEEKKRREQLQKFLQEAEDAQLAVMEEGAEKERAAAQLAAARKLRDLNAEIALTKEAGELRRRAAEQVERELAVTLERINIASAKQQAELRRSAQQQSLELSEDSLSKELGLLQVQYEARQAQINEDFKKENALRIALLKALDENLKRERERITREANVTAIDDQERAARAQVELMYAFAGESTKVEEAKQQDILRVQLKYAQLRLNALLEGGAELGSAEVAEAKLAVANITAELDKAIKSSGNKPLDLFSLLGLDDLTDNQKQALNEAARSIMQSVGEVTRFITQQYDAQIRKQQEVIDQLDEEISTLEADLEKEKELREKGFANNVEVLEKELAARKAARDEEIRQEQEIQKKKEAIQRAQMILDTAAQASNLITAASEIYAALAAIPFVGVALATATVGLMIGSFLAAKVLAFGAVSDAQSFGEGGIVDGNSHEAGGVKYYSKDGNSLRELEGGEFVTRKSQTARFRPLLEAINSGALDGMPKDYIADLLEGTGVHLQTDVQEKAIRIATERDNNRRATFGPASDNGHMLGEINKNVSFLATKARDQIEHWEDNEFYHTKAGNTHKKTRKKNGK